MHVYFALPYKANIQKITVALATIFYISLYTSCYSAIKGEDSNGNTSTNKNSFAPGSHHGAWLAIGGFGRARRRNEPVQTWSCHRYGHTPPKRGNRRGSSGLRRHKKECMIRFIDIFRPVYLLAAIRRLQVE